MKRSPGNKKVAKGIQAGSNRPGKKLIGTGFTSTLLSSQRTTAPEATCPRGTRSTLLGLPEIVNRFLPVHPICPSTIPRQAHSEAVVRRSKDLAGRPRRIAPLGCPHPCRLGKHYSVVPRAPNRVPVSPISPAQRAKTSRSPHARRPTSTRSAIRSASGDDARMTADATG